jgi:hypothetical protein
VTGSGANSLAVQMANSICIESKKKNMTNKEMLAPRGKHRACIVSRVCTLFSVWTCWDGFKRQLVLPFALSLASCSMFRLRNDPYTIKSIDMRKVDTLLESMIE